MRLLRWLGFSIRYPSPRLGERYLERVLCVLMGACIGFPAEPPSVAQAQVRLPDGVYRERALRNGWITDGGGPRFILDNVKLLPPRMSQHTPGEAWIDVMVRNTAYYNGVEEWKTASVYFGAP